MRVAYVLPRPELGGGAKVVFQHARLLAERGITATVLGEGTRPDWAPRDLPYRDWTAGAAGLPEQDLVIATFWTTFEPARRLGLGPLAHFCQGYEGGLVHLRPVLPEIERAYLEPLPTLVVSPHLADFLAERFGRESRLAPPPLDPLFRPRPRLFPRREPWIAVPGIFEAEVKGVPTALDAVARLRRGGLACRLLRLSILPLTPAEREIAAPDLYLCAVPPAVAAREVRRSDLLLFPSRAEEGFGLPLLEALGAKVPAVACRIPSVEFIDGGTGAVPRVPVGDGAAMAAAAREVLLDPVRWRRARRDGHAATRRFLPARVGDELVEALSWARARALTPSVPLSRDERGGGHPPSPPATHRLGIE